MIASAPRDGSRTKASASRTPVDAVEGTVASPRIDRPQNFSSVASEKRRSRSPGTSAISRKIRITPPAIADDTLEQRHIGAEHREGEGDRDEDPDQLRVGER